MQKKKQTLPGRAYATNATDMPEIRLTGLPVSTEKGCGFSPKKLSRLPEFSKLLEHSITPVTGVVPFIVMDYSQTTHHTFKNDPNWSLEHHISVLLFDLCSRTVCLCSEVTSL